MPPRSGTGAWTNAHARHCARSSGPAPCCGQSPAHRAPPTERPAHQAPPTGPHPLSSPGTELRPPCERSPAHPAPPIEHPAHQAPPTGFRPPSSLCTEPRPPHAERLVNAWACSVSPNVARAHLPGRGGSIARQGVPSQGTAHTLLRGGHAGSPGGVEQRLRGIAPHSFSAKRV